MVEANNARKHDRYEIIWSKSLRLISNVISLPRKKDERTDGRTRLTPQIQLLLLWDRLVGLVVKASASRAEDPGFDSRLRRDFFGVESYQ